MGTDPDILVLLTSTRTEFEAHTIAEALNAHGVPATVFGTAAATAQWELGIRNDFQVMVRRRDLQAAKDVLSGIKADSVDIDWDDVDVGEPTETSTAAAAQPRPATGKKWARRGCWVFFVLAMTWVFLPLAVPAAIIAMACELWLTLKQDRE